ncbi:MAG: hypothetical protein JXQ68_05140 [Campylobacterales bacterium]|nr:hypothetical protein [Campylobacterales bacterium]
MLKIQKVIISCMFIVTGFMTISYGNQALTKEGYRLTKEIKKDSTKTEIIIHTYDDNGNETKTVIGVDLNGDLALSGKEIKQVVRYTHDKNGKKLSESWSKANGLVESIETYTYDYDGDGNMLSEKFSGVRMSERTTIMTYDNDGNMLTKIFYFNDEKENAITHTYTYTKGVVPIDYKPNFIL